MRVGDAVGAGSGFAAVARLDFVLAAARRTTVVESVRRWRCCEVLVAAHAQSISAALAVAALTALPCPCHVVHAHRVCPIQTPLDFVSPSRSAGSRSCLVVGTMRVALLSSSRAGTDFDHEDLVWWS